MSIGLNNQTTNINNIQPKVQVAFKAQTTPVKNYPSDTVEIQGKKKKLSIGAKISIGVGVLLAGTIATIAILSKRMPKHIEKLYKEKLIPKTFDKKLVYKDATTIEEGIKYAKEILGVKEVDKNITLEALNFANSGITDVVNKNIGQGVFIPTKYLYTSSARKNIKDPNNWTAYVCRTISSKRFGELGLNKNYFDESFLNKKLKERFSNATMYDTLFKDIEGYGLQLTPVDQKGNNLKDLIKKFRKNPNSLSLEEKRALNSLDDDIRAVLSASDFNYAEFLKQNKINLDISGLKTSDEIRKAIDKYCKKNNKKLICNIQLSANAKKTIYHEMGHLQDYAKNLKELDLKNWKIDWKGIKNIEEISEVDNRWGGTSYKGFSELLKNNPEKFKKQYPDLYEFLTNGDIKRTAFKVSTYAATSIGEFIAETYAKMIAGVHLSDDVIALYKKYNGPLPNGFK